MTAAAVVPAVVAAAAAPIRRQVRRGSVQAAVLGATAAPPATAMPSPAMHLSSRRQGQRAGAGLCRISCCSAPPSTPCSRTRVVWAGAVSMQLVHLACRCFCGCPASRSTRDTRPVIGCAPAYPLATLTIDTLAFAESVALPAAAHPAACAVYNAHAAAAGGRISAAWPAAAAPLAAGRWRRLEWRSRWCTCSLLLLKLLLHEQEARLQFLRLKQL